MDSNAYLRTILNKYAVNVLGVEAAAQTLHPVIQKWGNIYILKTEFSGSLAKGTGNNIATDADIFISLSSKTQESLADIYDSLHNAVFQAGYPVKKQNVSIGTKVNGYKIDLVPGRRQSQYGSDHSLYKNKTGTWTQTNIATHINYVKGSNRVDEIRLAKIWRDLHNLEFPSFYIEMTVIDSLKYSPVGNLADNFLKVLEFLRDNLASSRYLDPANTNNVISADLSNLQKSVISNQAALSRSQPTWGSILW